MQRLLTHLPFRSLPACRFILHPTSRFVSQSARVPALQKQYLVGIGGRGVLLTSHRSYIRGADKHGETPKHSTKNDAIALNKKITNLGKQGKWKELLRLVEKEKNRLNNVNCATAFSQLGGTRNLDVHRHPLFKSFVNFYATCLESRGLEWAGNREVANVVYVIGKMQLKNKATESILAFLSKEENARKFIREGNTQTIANTAWAFARLDVKKSPEQLFAAIETRADWLVAKGKPQEIANTLWAFATLGGVKPPEKLCAAIENRASWFVANGKPQDLANTAWAFATLGVKSPKLFGEIDACAVERLVWDGTPQHIANTAWAFATLGIQAPELFARIESRWLVKTGTPQNVANVAWAFATLGVKSHTGFFAKIETRADWLVKTGTTQEIANTAWAFATLGVKPSHCTQLFAKIKSRADWLVRNGTPQEIANTAWAFAKLGVVDSPPKKLFSKIEKRADWLVTNGTPQAVANTAWASATLGVDAPELFAVIERRADWLVTNGTPQAVANTIWAAGRFQYYAPKLMEETDLRGAWMVKEGSAQEISNSAVAFARCGFDAPSFFAAVATNDGVSKIIDDANPQEIINVCYAMAVLDYLGKEKHSDAFCRLWNAAIDLEDPAAATMLPNEELLQLGQVLAFCNANGMTNVPQPSALLTQKIRAAVPDSARSKYQREVAKTLGRLGFLDYEEEVSPLEGRSDAMLSIDFASKKEMVAIEYDGKYHFLQELGGGRTRQENGPTKAKRRFLRNTGWRVINIDYRDWMDAERQNCQVEFLRKKLQQHTKRR